VANARWARGRARDLRRSLVRGRWGRADGVRESRRLCAREPRERAAVVRAGASELGQSTGGGDERMASANRGGCARGSHASGRRLIVRAGAMRAGGGCARLRDPRRCARGSQRAGAVYR
jgi:hypothetical protein